MPLHRTSGSRGGLKGSAQHFLDSMSRSVVVGHGDYERLTSEAIDLVWGRLRAGLAAKPTARELGLCTGTVRPYLLRCGGIRPLPRRRAPVRLRVEEREEISRGLAADLSFRVIAARLGRDPSTVSREVAGNGGRRKYRAAGADRQAWQRAADPSRASANRIGITWELSAGLWITCPAGLRCGPMRRRRGSLEWWRRHLAHPRPAMCGWRRR
jgi:hypothetical protein